MVPGWLPARPPPGEGGGGGGGGGVAGAARATTTVPAQHQECVQYSSSLTSKQQLLGEAVSLITHILTRPYLLIIIVVSDLIPCSSSCSGNARTGKGAAGPGSSTVSTAAAARRASRWWRLVRQDLRTSTSRLLPPLPSNSCGRLVGSLRLCYCYFYALRSSS